MLTCAYVHRAWWIRSWSSLVVALPVSDLSLVICQFLVSSYCLFSSWRPTCLGNWLAWTLNLPVGEVALRLRCLSAICRCWFLSVSRLVLLSFLFLKADLSWKLLTCVNANLPVGEAALWLRCPSAVCRCWFLSVSRLVLLSLLLEGWPVLAID